MLNLLNLIPGFSYIKDALLGVLVLGVGIVLAIGYYRFDKTERENVVLTGQVTQLGIALDMQKQVIIQQKEAIVEWGAALDSYKKAVSEYSKVQQQANTRQRSLTNAFQKHDLGKDAAARPQAVERELNSGTADTWSMLRCGSGATGADCPSPNTAPAQTGAAALARTSTNPPR